MSLCCLYSANTKEKVVSPRPCFANIFSDSKVKKIYYYVLHDYNNVLDDNENFNAHINNNSCLTQRQRLLYLSMFRKLGIKIKTFLNEEIEVKGLYDKKTIAKADIIEIDSATIKLSFRNFVLNCIRFLHETPFTENAEFIYKAYNETKGKYPIHWYFCLGATCKPSTGHNFVNYNSFLYLYKTDEEFIKCFHDYSSVLNCLKLAMFNVELSYLIAEKTDFNTIITKFFETCQTEKYI